MNPDFAEDRRREDAQLQFNKYLELRDKLANYLRTHYNFDPDEKDITELDGPDHDFEMTAHDLYVELTDGMKYYTSASKPVRKPKPFKEITNRYKTLITIIEQQNE